MDVPSPPNPPPTAQSPVVPKVLPRSGRRRTAPTLDDFAKNKVTAATAFLTVAFTFAFWGGWSGDALLLDSRAWNGQFWRLFTAVFLHLDLLHLAFNLYWLWVFGTVIESEFHPLRTAGIFVLFAVGSSAAQYAADGAGVGLSGVLYGLFGLLLVLTKWDPRFARVIDGKTTMLFIAWFALCWVMTRNGLWRIGNVAHGFGAILGLLLGFAVVTRGAIRMGVIASLVTGLVIVLIGGAMRPPSADELVYAGYLDLENGRNEEAAAKYQRAVEMDPNQPDWFRNLGIALLRSGRSEAALEACRRGLALRPQDRDLKETLLTAKQECAYLRHTQGDLAGAVTLYKEVLSEEKNSALMWYNLGTAYQALNQFESAQDAYAQAVKLEPSNKQFRDALEGLQGGHEKK